MKKDVVFESYIAGLVLLMLESGVGSTVERQHSITVKPTKDNLFQVKLHGDYSFREDVFVCKAADDRTVVGEFLTGHWKGSTHVFQRERTEFFLNSPSVLRELFKRSKR